MKTTKKEIEGFKMYGYRDPCGEWVIQSWSISGVSNTGRYQTNKFTLTSAFEFHYSIFKD